MDIDWARYKQIILNDKPTGYRPDKQLLRRLRRLFPDISIWGFGKYYDNYWFILAHSSKFPENTFAVHPGSTPLTEVFKWVAPILVPLPTA